MRTDFFHEPWVQELAARAARPDGTLDMDLLIAAYRDIWGDECAGRRPREAG
jgi:hypothetical protein